MKVTRSMAALCLGAIVLPWWEIEQNLDFLTLEISLDGVASPGGGCRGVLMIAG